MRSFQEVAVQFVATSVPEKSPVQEAVVFDKILALAAMVAMAIAIIYAALVH
jgi:hypothetical protein